MLCLLIKCCSLFDEALKLMQRAVTPPTRKVDYHDQVSSMVDLSVKE